MKLTKIKLGLISIAIIVMFTFVCGISLGMMLEQRLIGIVAQEAFAYTSFDIDVNFNETKLVQELNNTFIPNLKNALNETIV